MKNRKRFLYALALLFCLSWLPRAAAPEDTPEDTQMLDSVRQSVVHLYGIGYGSTGIIQSRWSGTGFAVGIAGTDSDVFLTNRHVVTGNGKFGLKDVRLWLLTDDARFYPNREPMPGSAIECEILSITDGYPDVAVIRAMDSAAARPALPLLSSRRVADGTQVYALGFPGLEATHDGTDSGPEDLEVTSGIVSDHLTMSKAGFTRSLIHTAAICRGKSGGPLVNRQGAVVGQNTYGFQESVTTEYFCSVYIDYGMALLDALGLPYSTAPGPSRITVLAANALHLPQIGDAAAFAVFLLALLPAIAFLLYFLKALRKAAEEFRRKRPAKPHLPRPTDFPDESSDQGSSDEIR